MEGLCRSGSTPAIRMRRNAVKRRQLRCAPTNCRALQVLYGPVGKGDTIRGCTQGSPPDRIDPHTH